MSDSDSYFVGLGEGNILFGHFYLDNGTVISVGELLKLLTREEKLKLVKRINLSFKRKECDCNVL